MEPDKLRLHLLATYCALRFGLALLALAFPITLVVIGLHEGVPVQHTLSDYYFAFPEDLDVRAFPTRTWFVGILFAIGALLVLYRGYSRTEDLMLDVAGVCAFIVAVFPTVVPDYCKNCGEFPFTWLHTAAAVTMFLCLAFVALTSSQETLSRLPPNSTRRWWYRTLYDLIALFMIGLPIAGIIMAFVVDWSSSNVLIVEWMAIYAFAAYWLLKTVELCVDREGKRMDEMAVTGAMPHETMRTAPNGSSWDARRLQLGRILD